VVGVEVPDPNVIAVSFTVSGVITPPISA